MALSAGGKLAVQRLAVKFTLMLRKQHLNGLACKLISRVTELRYGSQIDVNDASPTIDNDQSLANRSEILLVYHRISSMSSGEAANDWPEKSV